MNHEHSLRQEPRAMGTRWKGKGWTMSLPLWAAGLSACALNYGQRPEDITIETPYVTQAACTLTDRGGREWKLEQTPGTVTVFRGGGVLHIICRKRGFETVAATVEPQTFQTREMAHIFRAEHWTDILARNPQGYYPPVVQVWLAPTRFKSEEAEEAWNRERRLSELAAAERYSRPGKWAANRLTGVEAGRFGFPEVALPPPPFNKSAERQWDPPPPVDRDQQPPEWIP